MAVAELTLRAGESAAFVLEQARPGAPSAAGPGVSFVSEAFKETVNFWRRWVARSNYVGRWREMVNRSALTLKLLTSRQHGSIVAAPTFGLHFVYRAPSGWGPYIGFSQHRFDCGADGCPGAEYVATMWDTGMQRTVGRNGPLWIRLGVLFARTERELVAPAGTERAIELLDRYPNGGAHAELAAAVRATAARTLAWIRLQEEKLGKFEHDLGARSVRLPLLTSEEFGLAEIEQLADVLGPPRAEARR